MEMCKVRRAIVVAAIVAACSAERAAAHGFQVITIGGGAAGAGGTAGASTTAAASANSGGSNASGRNQGAGTTPSAPGGGAGPGRNGGGGRAVGGATGARGAGGRGLPFGLGRRRRPAAEKPVDVDAAPKASAAALPNDPIARGRAVRRLLADDLADDADLAFVIETTATDARLRSVPLRLRVAERRRAGDVRRRIEVEAKRGDAYERVETALLRRIAGRLEVATRGATGAPTRFRDAAAVAIAGTTLRWIDLAAFDAAGEFRFVADSTVDGAPVESYVVRGAAGGEESVLSLRMDSRLPMRRDVRRDGVTTRAYDWSGWRFYAGTPVPERITVTGPAGETTVLEVREAGLSSAGTAPAFEVSSL